MPKRAALEPTRGQFGSVGDLGKAAATAVARELGMTREQVQRWLDCGDKVQAGFAEVLKQYGLLVNPFDSERVKQAWSYQLDMPPLESQAEHLRRVLGIELKWPEGAQNMPLPTGSYATDGIALWPTLSALAKLWNISHPYDSGYGEIIAATCQAINHDDKMLPLVNYLDGQLTDRHVRLHHEVRDWIVALEREAERQGYNALAMPVNLGNWRTGDCYSPHNARWQCLNLHPKRLPIEPVAGLSLIVGVPKRLTSGQLFCDFPGAEYFWEADGGWPGTLCCSCVVGRFGFFAYGAGYARDYCGAFFASPGV